MARSSYIPSPADDDGASTPSPKAAFSTVSKTQRKKNMQDLQTLGEALIALPDEHLRALAMPERLFDALCDYKKTKSHEGRRRQMQFIGKLMRSAEEAPLREAVAAFELGAARNTLDLHRAEAWRSRLLADPEGVTAWMQAFPETDLVHLRTLIRQAKQDASLQPEERSGKAFRALFQTIKQALAPSV
jgi:ribosome-associated protein